MENKPLSAREISQLARPYVCRVCGILMRAGVCGLADKSACRQDWTPYPYFKPGHEPKKKRP